MGLREAIVLRRMDVALRLRKLRKACGFSQFQVASYIGIPVTTYAAYEQGRNEAPLEFYVRFVDLFGVSLDYLFTGGEF